MRIETIIQWLRGSVAYASLGVVLYGVWRGTRQQAGRTVGLSGSWLRSWWFYLASSLFFFGIAYWGWKPLPLTISSSVQTVMLIVGALLYFPGMLFLLWARLTLGKTISSQPVSALSYSRNTNSSQTDRMPLCAIRCTRD